MYPKQHRKIVSELLAGRFILQKSELFDVITQKNKNFYIEFFENSFGYELKITHEFIYLISSETNEKLSRNITLFLAVLCYELDRIGQNFAQEIKYGYFDLEDVKQKLLQSEYKEVLGHEDIANIHKLIGQLADRNIVERKSDNKFVFTAAISVFFDLAESYLGEHDKQA